MPGTWIRLPRWPRSARATRREGVGAGSPESGRLAHQPSGRLYCRPPRPSRPRPAARHDVTDL